MHFRQNWTALIANLLLIQLLGTQHATAAAIEGRSGTTRYNIPILKSRPSTTRTALLTRLPVFAIYSAPPESHTSYAACSFKKCGGGKACRVQGPLSRSLTASATSIDCAKFSTRTTDTLPTASYGTPRGYNVLQATPTSISNKSSLLQDRELIANQTLDKRQGIYQSDHWGLQSGIYDFDHASKISEFITDLNLWASHRTDVSGQWLEFPLIGWAATGVNGLYGCTAVVIVSARGVYLSHIFEEPVFANESPSGNVDTHNTVFWDYIHSLNKGAEGVQSIAELVGTKEKPGPLNAIYSPQVFVIGPQTSDFDRAHGVSTFMLYQARTFDIAKYVGGLIPGSLSKVMYYERTPDSETSETSDRSGWKGKIMLEVNAYDGWLEAIKDPTNLGRPVTSWALWIQGQKVHVDEFPIAWFDPNTHTAFGKRGMDLIGKSPCPDEC